MVNFKVGDVVERFDDDFLQLVGPGPHIVTGVNTAGWLQINRWKAYSGDEYPWYPDYFTLVDGGYDELPPAPKSVLYFNSIRSEGNDQCITVRPDDDPRYEGTLCISVHPRGDYTGYQSVALDPDAALQLAHDLHRMAMEIKRKGKHNGYL